MKLLVNVNQKESIRAGQDAPHSTFTYDINPSDLPEELRKWVADYWDPATGKVRAQVLRNGSRYGEEPTIILPATKEALIAALQYLKAGAEAVEEKERNQRAEMEAKIAAYVDRWKSDPKGLTVWWGERITMKDAPYYISGAYYGAEQKEATLPEALWPLYDRVVGEMIAERQAKEAGEQAKKASEQAEQLERNNQAATRLKAQLDTFVASVGGTFAERHAAGYATDKELRQRIREAELAARSLECKGGPADWLREHCEEWGSGLDDQQFLALKEFKAKLPPESEQRLFEMWNVSRGEYDEKFKDTRTDRILVAEAAFTVGEIKVTADHLIGELPDIDPEED